MKQKICGLTMAAALLTAMPVLGTEAQSAPESYGGAQSLCCGGYAYGGDYYCEGDQCYRGRNNN